MISKVIVAKTQGNLGTQGNLNTQGTPKTAILHLANNFILSKQIPIKPP